MTFFLRVVTYHLNGRCLFHLEVQLQITYFTIVAMGAPYPQLMGVTTAMADYQFLSDISPATPWLTRLGPKQISHFFRGAAPVVRNRVQVWPLTVTNGAQKK